ncbi:hypothetical protein M949_1370 [Riemerella anatipestifer CH3]|nr:hypothetical protein M949_1370 [Riemerella anatipestifer CH3]
MPQPKKASYFFVKKSNKIKTLKQEYKFIPNVENPRVFNTEKIEFT